MNADALTKWLGSDAVRTRDGWVVSWANDEHPGYPYPEASAYVLRLLAAGRDPRATPRVEELTALLASELATRGGIGRAGILYVFDTAMALAALASAARAGVPVDRMALSRGATFVSDGLVRGRAASDRTGWLEGDRWSTRWNAHLLKCAIGIEEVRSLGVDTPVALADVADRFVRTQQPDGGFPLAVDGDVDSHVHLYALEGLAWLQARDGRWLDALRRGLDWVATVQRDDGGIPRRVPGPPDDTRCDVTAQAARLFSLVADPRHAPALRRALAYLEALAVPGGGVRYRPASHDQPTWGAVFAAQALRLAAGDLTIGDLA